MASGDRRRDRRGLSLRLARSSEDHHVRHGRDGTDVSVVEQGTPVTAAQKSYHGYPVRRRCSTGFDRRRGGSLLDRSGGFLRVGSAERRRRPARRIRPWRRLVHGDRRQPRIGRLDADYFLGAPCASITIAAPQRSSASSRGPCLSVTDAALGIVKVVDAGMAAPFACDRRARP